MIITHDSDFGTLAILAGEPTLGVIYLRPGHIGPTFTAGTVRVLVDHDLDLQAPFIIVARRKGNIVKIRIRSL